MTKIDVEGTDGEKWTGSLAIRGSPTANDNNCSNGVDETAPERSGGIDDVEESTPIMQMEDIDETKGYDEEAVTFPESTHSYLFTEPVQSIPFAFGLAIVGMSYTCLVLALINNVSDWSVPANVDTEVKIAQYLSILIALLMEEEIPTGLYLLRRISQPYLKSQCPEVSYWRFVGSCVLRITMGELFLANVIVILIRAEGVIEIFYDVLALQFIQQLDDIAFSLSKMSVLGKALQRATMTPYFNVEFQKQKSMGLKWRYKVALKGLYFLHLFVFVAIMSIVTHRQMNGFYQCSSITVLFGDEVWDEANVNWPDGRQEEMILFYSYFNGVYVKDESRANQGRPIYIEQNKYDHTPFDKNGSPPANERGDRMDPTKPAEIMYCDGHWIFTHEYITKSSRHDSECNWLARSPETSGFDVLEVTGAWQTWIGALKKTDVSIACNECNDDEDCNLNGSCNVGTKECECDDEDGVNYFGTHCEVKIRDECRTIVGETFNDEWSIDTTSSPMGQSTEIVQTYNRPVYIYVKQESFSNGEEVLGVSDADDQALMYSGSRWFLVLLEGHTDEATSGLYEWIFANYHAFWFRMFTPGVTFLVSDVTTKDTPVGVDFYWVGERGDQFEPFGAALHPIKNVTVAGRGHFRCKPSCTFCSDGLSVSDDFLIPPDPNDPNNETVTCGALRDYVEVNAVKKGSILCEHIQLGEQICCPRNSTAQSLILTVDSALNAANSSTNSDP